MEGDGETHLANVLGVSLFDEDCVKATRYSDLARNESLDDVFPQPVPSVVLCFWFSFFLGAVCVGDYRRCTCGTNSRVSPNDDRVTAVGSKADRGVIRNKMRCCAVHHSLLPLLPFSSFFVFPLLSSSIV